MKVENDIINISASVSCFDLYNFEKDYKQIEKTEISFLHYDVVDGFRSDRLVLGTVLLDAIRPHVNMPIEVHLAADEPERFIPQFADAGADYIAVHFETMKDPLRIFRLIEKKGAIPVLALESRTPVNRQVLEICGDIPWILKLTVNTGYAGQKMQKQAIEHIRDIRLLLDETSLKTRIEADGNINEITIPEVVTAGADILTGGSSGLFKRDDTIANNAARMMAAAKKALEEKRRFEVY